MHREKSDPIEDPFRPKGTRREQVVRVSWTDKYRHPRHRDYVCTNVSRDEALDSVAEMVVTEGPWRKIIKPEFNADKTRMVTSGGTNFTIRILE